MRRYVTPSAQASGLRPSRVSHGSSVSPQEATYSNHSKSRRRRRAPPGARRVEADHRAGEVVTAGAPRIVSAENARVGTRPSSSRRARPAAEAVLARRGRELERHRADRRARAAPSVVVTPPQRDVEAKLPAARAGRHDERRVERPRSPGRRARPARPRSRARTGAAPVRSSRSAAGAGRRAPASATSLSVAALPQRRRNPVARGASRPPRAGFRTKTSPWEGGRRRKSRSLGRVGHRCACEAAVPRIRARRAACAASRRRPSGRARGTSRDRGGGAGRRSAGCRAARPRSCRPRGRRGRRARWPGSDAAGRSRCVSSGPCGEGSNGPYGSRLARDDDRVPVARAALRGQQVVPAAAAIEVRRLRPDAARALPDHAWRRARSAARPARVSSPW